MELHWLKRDGNDGLVLFILGWAADHRVVEHIRPAGCDILVVYDYSEGIDERSIDGSLGSVFDNGGGNSMAAVDMRDNFVHSSQLRNIVGAYRQTWLFAWSFGVWVAEQLLAGAELTRAVALNGTPHPVDGLYGIEPRRMAVTIRGLRAGGMEAFNRRAYGEHFEHLKPVLLSRPLDRNVAELEYLALASAVDYTPSVKWSKAVIGSGDQIFPPENMTRFWGSRAEILPLPHYPFADGELIEKEIGRR